MIYEKLLLLYALIGVWIGFIPLFEARFGNSYESAKEEFGHTAAFLMLLASAFMIFLFWPFFLFSVKK